MDIQFERFIKEQKIQDNLKHLNSIENYLCDLREKYQRNQICIKEAEIKSRDAKEFKELQNGDNELTQNLSKLKTKHEIFENFQFAVNNGFHPILSDQPLNIIDKTTFKKLLAKQLSEIETQIFEIESVRKKLSSKLKDAYEAGWLAQLEILRSREIEIGDEGKRLKAEKEYLEFAIHNSKIKLSNLSKAKSDVYERETKCTVGTTLLRVAKLIFSEKTYTEVFLQKVGDWQEEYIKELKKGKLFKAIKISAINYADFIYWMLVCSKVGEIFNFIVKLIGVVGIIIKFWK